MTGGPAEGPGAPASQGDSAAPAGGPSPAPGSAPHENGAPGGFDRPGAPDENGVPGAVEAGRSSARRLAWQLARVRDVVHWAPLVAEFCACEGQPVAAAHRMNAALRAAVTGEARDPWLGFALGAAAETLVYEDVRSLYAGASVAGLRALQIVLLAGDEPHAAVDDSAFPPDDLLGSMTLGERKALARRPDPATIDRLIFDADPSVVRILLDNPRATEALVLRLAARRPNRGASLAEVGRARRWLLRPAVRRALVLNPFTPPRLGAVLLPLLAARDRRAVGRDRSLHPLLRELVAALDLR